MEGQFKDGTCDGWVRWIWSDGLCYEGYVKDFKQEGKGILRHGNCYKDIVSEGTWRNGKLITGEIYR
jgi:hypothetical protein